MYLICDTRPEIAYGVRVLSRSLKNTTRKGTIRVKRVLGYGF